MQAPGKGGLSLKVTAGIQMLRDHGMGDFDCAKPQADVKFSALTVREPILIGRGEYVCVHAGMLP